MSYTTITTRVIACDGVGCTRTVSSRRINKDGALDRLRIPGDWRLITQNGKVCQHFCSLACLKVWADAQPVSHTTWQMSDPVPLIWSGAWGRES